MSLSELALSPRRTVLLVVDVQERLIAAMPEAARLRVERNTVTLLEAARRLGLPVIASEQYPRGLGATIPAVAAGLEAAGDQVTRFDKLEFSVCEAPPFAPAAARLASAGRDQWLVVGMEAHVCVWQSVRGLRARGAAVHVLADAVASRAEGNERLGLELAARAGAVISSTEIAVFDLLGRAGTDDFKALSRLIR